MFFFAFFIFLPYCETTLKSLFIAEFDRFNFKSNIELTNL